MQSNAESVLSESDPLVCNIPEVAMNEPSKQHLDHQLKQNIVTLRIMFGFNGDESSDKERDSAENQSKHGKRDSHNADESSVDEEDLISDNIGQASSHDGNHFHEEDLSKFDVSDENNDFAQSGASENDISIAKSGESDKDIIESPKSGKDHEKSQECEELAQSGQFDEDRNKSGESDEESNESEFDKYDDLTESDEDVDCPESRNDDDLSDEEIIPKSAEFVEDDSEDDTEESDKHDDLTKFDEEDDMAESDDLSENDNIPKTNSEKYDDLTESDEDKSPSESDNYGDLCEDEINLKSAEFVEDSEDDSENDTDEFDKYDDLTESDEDDDHLTESDDDNEDEIIPKSKEFIEDDENDSEDETEDQQQITEINKKWNKFYSVISTAKKSTKSVWFSSRRDVRIPVLNEVEWAEEYIAARIGPWEAFVADRNRFIQRVRKLKKEIGWVFDADHRAKIFDLLQSNAEELAYINDTSNAATEQVSCIDEDVILEECDLAEEDEDLGELHMLDNYEGLVQSIQFDEALTEPDEFDEQLLQSDQSDQIDVFSESYENEYLTESDEDEDLSEDEIIPKSAEFIEDSEDDSEDDITKPDDDDDMAESDNFTENEIIPKSKEFIDDDEYNSSRQHHEDNKNLAKSHESVKKESIAQSFPSNEDLHEYAQSDKDQCESVQFEKNFTEDVQFEEDHHAKSVESETDNDLSESDNSVKGEELVLSSQSDENLREFDECDEYLLELVESDENAVLSEPYEEEYLTQSDKDDDLSKDESILNSAEFKEDESEDDYDDDTEEFDKYDDLTESEEDDDDHLTEYEDDNEDEIIPKSKEFIEDDEDDSGDETEDQKRMKEINQKWENFYSVESAAKKSSKSVWFSARRDARIPILNETEWAEEYIAARIGPWEAFVADRDRFVQRVRKLKKEIEWVFYAAHRAKIFDLLKSNAQEQARSNHTSIAATEELPFIEAGVDLVESDHAEKYEDLEEFCKLDYDENLEQSIQFDENLTEPDESDEKLLKAVESDQIDSLCESYEDSQQSDNLSEDEIISKLAEFAEDSEHDSEDETEEFDKYDDFKDSDEDDYDNLTESLDGNEYEIIPKSAEFIEDNEDDSEDDTYLTVLHCNPDSLPIINGVSPAYVDLSSEIIFKTL